LYEEINVIRLVVKISQSGGISKLSYCTPPLTPAPTLPAPVTLAPTTPLPTASQTEFCRLFGEVNCFLDGTRKGCSSTEPPEKECFCENGVESIMIRYGGMNSGYVKCADELYGPFDNGNTFSVESPPSAHLPAMLQMNLVL
jgi:hypothetical protein